MKKYLLSLFLLMLFNVVNAQSDCKSTLKKAYDYLNSFTLEKNKGMCISYQVTTKFKKGGKTVIKKERVELFINSEKTYMSTSATSIFKDNKCQVSVMENQKIIYLTDVDKNYNSKVIENSMSINDSLLNLSTLACEKVKDGEDRGMLKIVLIPEKKVTEGLKIKKITYWLENTNVCRKVKMEYQGQPLIEVFLIVEKQDYNYKKEIFKGKATDHIFDGKGKLLPKYQDFKVIDVRKK